MKEYAYVLLAPGSCSWLSNVVTDVCSCALPCRQEVRFEIIIVGVEGPTAT
jgi:hypothetical protein